MAHVLLLILFMTPIARSGFEIGNLGLPETLNPFPEGTPNHLVWALFWLDGDALLKSQQLEARLTLKQIGRQPIPNYLRNTK
jgi:hypothetical protein